MTFTATSQDTGIIARGTDKLAFAGFESVVDNSTAAALLDMLKAYAETPWAAVVLSKSGGTLETAVGFRLFLNLLRQQAKDSGADIREGDFNTEVGLQKLRDLLQRALTMEPGFALGYAFVGIGKFAAEYIPLSPTVCAILIMSVTTLYAMAGGFEARRQAIDLHPILDRWTRQLRGMRDGGNVQQ